MPCGLGRRKTRKPPRQRPEALLRNKRPAGKSAGFFLKSTFKERSLMRNTSDLWIIKAGLPFVIFAVPSFVIVLKLWFQRKKQAGESGWPDLPRQISIGFILSYLFWLLDQVLLSARYRHDWMTGFLVAWPLLGILFSLIGCGLAFLARDGEKAKLLIANILFLALSLSSIIAPN
jgi:hypothetical protein